MGTDELQTALGVGRNTAYQLIHSGDLQFIKIPKRYLIRFHELRHTTGSLLLEKGLSAKQIQEYLGHEKVSTTLDIYGHLSIEGKKEAAHVMDGMLDIKAM